MNFYGPMPCQAVKIQLRTGYIMTQVIKLKIINLLKINY